MDLKLIQRSSTTKQKENESDEPLERPDEILASLRANSSMSVKSKDKTGKVDPSQSSASVIPSNPSAKPVKKR